MSWEETSRSEKPCYCGKGKLITIYESDDWFQHREHSYFECSDCAEEERKRLIAQEKKDEKTRERIKKLKEEIKLYFEEKYMKDWIAFFSACKSKKAHFILAKEIGVDSGSLSRFYDHYRNSTMEGYIRYQTTVHSMPKIIEALKIKDDYLESRVSEVIELADGNRHGYLIWNH